MELSLLMIVGIPLLSIFIFICEEMTQKGKKLFSILSIALLVLMAIVGVILDVNVYMVK